jgi:hypothetical protein
MAKDELDKLAEQPDPCFLTRRGVPALENADQPVRIPGAWRHTAPVGMRQQQVKGRGAEVQQRFVRTNRVVADINRAQNSAVTVPEFRRLQKAKSFRDRVETVAAISVAPVPPGRLGVTVQAHANSDSKALERGEHRPVEESAVRLEGDVHLRGDRSMEFADQAT